MTKPEIIETIDEDGNIVNLELVCIIEVDDQEYGLLREKTDDENDEEKEVVPMRLIEQGDDWTFEVIEDDKEFDRVVAFIEELEEMDED